MEIIPALVSKPEPEFVSRDASLSALPIAAIESQIIDAVNYNLVTAVISGTGSGKSTLVPRFLYEYGVCHYCY